jgi:hypothetical protein
MSILNIQWGNPINTTKELFEINFNADSDDPVDFNGFIKFIIEHKPIFVFIEPIEIKGEIIGKMLNFLVKANYELTLYTNPEIGIEKNYDKILTASDYESKIGLKQKNYEK